MSEETVEKKEEVKKSGIPVSRVIGIVLIAAAVALYFRSYRSKTVEYDAAVAMCEALMENGVARVSVVHTLEGVDLPPVLYPCDIDTATNLLSCLVNVKPVPMPKGQIEGDLFVIHILGTNNVLREFRAIRPAADPSNALVGLITRGKDADGAATETVAPPALALGAGDVLGGILKKLVEGGEKIAADPKFHESFTNLLERVAAERAAKAEEKPAAEEAPAGQP